MKIEQRITVSFEFPVVFTHGLFEPGNNVFAETIARAGESSPVRAACFIDSNVAMHHSKLSGQIQEYFMARGERMALVEAPVVLPGGEMAKSDLRLVESLCAALLDHRMDRHSHVIAIGGGALLDAVGLAAALVHRGLRLIRVPTTVLSQNDAGVGVKNGVNFQGTKNALGTFAPPFAVLNDFDFLRTLPDREWRGGIAEAFKVAIIRDDAFFDWLCENAAHFRARDTEAIERLVVRCAELHLEHIRTNGDPFEAGHARPLDFGHWAAHKIELLSHFAVSHGEAVAVGIALDSYYAKLCGWLTGEEFERIFQGLSRSGLRPWVDELERPELFEEGLREFREHLGGRLCLTYPRGIGHRHEVHEIDAGTLTEAVRELKRLNSTIDPLFP